MPMILVRNDITKMNTDAIVLPANEQLLEGSGTSRGIYMAAGEQQLINELKSKFPDGCKPGEAVITKGYDLQASHIIHAVCPQWLGGNKGEAQLLYNSYASSLNLAKANNLNSIAFPLLSTGNYNYPKAEALNVANHAITDFLQENEMDVYLVFYGSAALREGSKLYSHIESYIDDNYVAEKDQEFIGTTCRRRPVESCQAKSVEFFHTLHGNSTYDECSADYSLDIDVCPENFDDIWDEDVDNFHDMLFQLIDRSGKKDSQVYKAGNISKQTFSNIRSNPDMIPTKKTIIGLAFGLELTLDETKELLEIAGFALSKASKFDTIVSCFLNDRNYNIINLNMFLFDHGLEHEMI